MIPPSPDTTTDFFSDLLAVGRVLEQNARAAGIELPMPPQDLATVMRELGVGLALAQLADPDAIPERLYGDFVEVFCGLALNGSEERNES